MNAANDLIQSWKALPEGARVALEEQWAGLAVAGLPCGSAVTDASGSVIARGRNHAYDPAGGVDTRARYPLQHNRLAHAELNALACISTETDHATLALWTTQHPCSMCAAAIAFVGIGQVHYIADDPSDHSPPENIVASRAGVPYRQLGDPLWWTVSNLLFLYGTAVVVGENAENLQTNRERYPELVRLTIDLARRRTLGDAARSGTSLPVALKADFAAIERVAAHAPSSPS
jgi:tRNA(Arg) A34 adenosine deaminase TadA